MRTTDAPVALDNVFDSCALFDQSDLGRLLGTGPDLLDLVHRLSTGDVCGLGPGTGRPTVLTTSKGRIIDLLFVHHLGDKGVLLVGGTGSAERIVTHLERYTFAEQTGLRDITAESYQFTLIGPASKQALSSCGLEPPGACHVTEVTIGGKTAHLLGQNGFTAEDVSITGPLTDAADVQHALTEAVRQAGGDFAGADILETYRILRGLPRAGHELTGEHNPLEAGLREAVSFDKGCYVGQEVVARLQTYDKISRSIVGLELQTGSVVPQNGTALHHEDRVVGVLTSAALPPGREHAVALGYVKRKELRPDLLLQVGADGPTARVVGLPFPRCRAE